MRGRTRAPGPGTGVDGCKSGWFYVSLSASGYAHGIAADAGALFAALTPEHPVFIDIPIGLAPPGSRGRACDREARARLGPRRSSVFATPSRAALAGADYAEASALNLAASGRKLSVQAYGIVPKIRELDWLLRHTPQLRARVFEAHPELCFWALAGQRPMAHPKKTPAGFEERAEVLEQHWPGARDAVAHAQRWCRGAGVARDDVVDAFANALCAMQPQTRRVSLPQPVPADEHGLPMCISYASPA